MSEDERKARMRVSGRASTSKNRTKNRARTAAEMVAARPATKRCPACLCMMPAKAFGLSRAEVCGLRGVCRLCERIRQARNRHGSFGAARSRGRHNVLAQRLEATTMIDHGGRCVDCGRTYPYESLEWDHCRGTKLGTLSKLSLRSDTFDNVKLLVAELAKCELVCANCHAVRTKLRANRKLTAHMLWRQRLLNRQLDAQRKREAAIAVLARHQMGELTCA